MIGKNLKEKLIEEIEKKISSYVPDIEDIAKIEYKILTENLNNSENYLKYNVCIEMKIIENSLSKIKKEKPDDVIETLNKYIEEEMNKESNYIKNQNNIPLYFKTLRNNYLAKSKSNFKFKDIGGMWDVKKRIMNDIILPFSNPKYDLFDINPETGLILYGPPGTGKTALAAAISNELGRKTVFIKGPEILSKWFGESERNLRKLFEKASKNKTTIIFDEFDSIGKTRKGECEASDRVINQLLTLMDGIKKRDILVIGTTNRIDLIDPALLRPGRFGLQIEIPLPDEETRYEILRRYLGTFPLHEDVELEKYAKKTKGFNGAELENFSKKARLNAIIRSENDEIPAEKLRITPEDIEKTFEEFIPKK